MVAGPDTAEIVLTFCGRSGAAEADVTSDAARSEVAIDSSGFMSISIFARALGKASINGAECSVVRQFATRYEQQFVQRSLLIVGLSARTATHEFATHSQPDCKRYLSPREF